MKRETPYSSNEDDSSDDSDITKESRSKKTTKISRAVPLPVSIETEGVTAAPESKPVLSFGERFMQELQRRAAREQEKAVEEAVEEDESDDDEDADDSTPAVASPHAPSEDAEPVTMVERNDVRGVPEAPRPDTLEAADWEAEPEAAPADSEERDPDYADVPLGSPDAVEEAVEEIAPDLLETGLGSEGPPEPPSIAEDEPTYPEFGPERRDTMVPVHESPWYSPADREPARAAGQHEDALYHAEKRGLRRGLGAGLLFGWMFGRRGKKQAAEQHKREIDSKNKELTALKQEQVLAQQRLEAIQRTQESLRANITEKPPVAPQAGKKTAESVRLGPEATVSPADSAVNQEVNHKPRLKVAEIVAMTAAEVVAVTEGAHQKVEAPAAASAVEKQKVTAEKLPLPPEEQEITEDTYTVSKDRKVESSAWHRIEVDAKTGRPILDPEVAYGEEFKREQRQEVWKDRPGDTDTKTSAGILGSLAAGALASGSSGTPGENSVESDKNDQALTVPYPEEIKNTIHADNRLVKYASSPLLWALAAGVVLLLFIFGLAR